MHNSFILKPKIILIRFHLLSFVVPLVVISCTTGCHLLSLVVTCCHSLSLVVPLFVTRCTTPCHSLPFVVLLAVICCHSLYHSLSLDIPLVCLFIKQSFYIVEILVPLINDTHKRKLCFTQFSTRMAA